MSKPKIFTRKKIPKILLVSTLILLTLITTTSTANAADTNNCELLIIGPPQYEQAIQNFMDFKLTQQITARYVSTETLALSQFQQPTKRLHDFISDQINQLHIRYVLLVGNYDQVPTRYVYCPSDEGEFADFNYKPTDWYYAVPDWEDSRIGFLGANIPQIAVGRLPVKDKQELEQTLIKIMNAQSNRSNSSLVVLNEPSLSLDPTLSVPYASYTLDQNLTTLDQALSSDHRYVASYTHGTASALWTKTENAEWKPLFTNSDAANLRSNFDIFYIVACFTGALDLKEESLARTLLTSPAGPALVIASSRTEGSDNKISAKFWEEFFETGKVGDSLVESLSSYLTDETVFSPDTQSFQKYNFYLNKVVYGDVSWREETTQVNQPDSPAQLVQTDLALSGNNEQQLPAHKNSNLAPSWIGLPMVWSLFTCALLVRVFGFRKKAKVSQI